MGKTKLERMIRDMVVSGVRAVEPLVDAVPKQCKFCGSKRVVRYGHYQNVQRWWCKDCKRKFVYNDALPRMKTPIIQIASALSMYYEGMSLHGIRRNFEQTYRSYPSNSTIYEWVIRFTKLAVRLAQNYTPIVGDTWVADETVLRIEGRNVWFWDIIDDRTRFLLASHISVARGARDARILVERAKVRVGKVPKVIVTDKLLAYLDGIELAFGSETKHIPVKGLVGNKNIIERFHGTLKARTKVMRGLKKRETAKLITDGWLVHYNFFRPHEGLGNRTPAQKAMAKFPYRNWLDIVARGGK